MPLQIVIISGGQTGADRAALDWAISHSIPHGGWCPQGRTTSEGPLDAKYQLRETPSDEHVERTEWNVRDSDATVVFTLAAQPVGMARKTITCARKLKKPCLHLHRGILAVSEKLLTFVEKHQVRRLNLTGSSESEEAGLAAWVGMSLEKLKAMADRQDE
ncbi:MAG: putative molybdenum carrier protein [Verrucomicrobiaceae bacterium]